MRLGSVAPSGTVALARMPSSWPERHGLREVFAHALPRPGLGRAVNGWRMRNLRYIWRGLWRLAVMRSASWLTGTPFAYGALYLDVVNRETGERTPLGLASLRVVTDTGVAFIVDAFQNTTELENLKFHGFGTGTTAEAASQTALVTELTTEYATDNTRPTGTTTEGASANIYRTVGTLDPDSAVAITEHGVFSQAATGGGTMLDRSVFSAINLAASGDTLQATYDLTFSSGG